MRKKIEIDKPKDNSVEKEELILESNSLPITATTSSATWYCSDSVYNLIGGGVLSLQDISHPDLPKNQQFNIELAVAAGNIYHMLLGEPQPKFYSGFDKNGVYYRLSKKVPEFTVWGDCIKEIEEINKPPVTEEQDGGEEINQLQDPEEQDESEDTNATQYTVLGNKLIKGTNTFELGDQKGKINRIVSAAIVSFFLADIDTNPGNFGLVNDINNYYMIKLDPECCLNYLFFSQGATNILMGLNDIVRHHSQDFFQNFTDNFSTDEVDDCDWDVVIGFMNTESANLEKFEIIYKIINTPLEDYETILRSCIDKKYNDQIEIILLGFKNRIELFSQCANQLEGYKEYCAQINPPVNTELVTTPEEENIDEPVENFSDNANRFFSKRKAEVINKPNKKIKTEKLEGEQPLNNFGLTDM